MNSTNIQHDQTKQEQQTQNDFVYRLLSDHANRTEDIVAELMEKAIIAPNPLTEMGSTPQEKASFRDMSRKMACKFLWILWNSERVAANHGRKPWVPTKSCVDLTTTGASLTRDEQAMSADEVRQMWMTDRDLVIRGRKTKRTPRRFVNCLGCDKRFLAKRKNNTTCSPRCQRRALRKSPMSEITCQSPLQPA
jgi:hypothetical protein